MNVAERQARFREKLRLLAEEPQRLPSGNYTDVCHDCGTRIVASTPEDVDGARCACPPQRFEYVLELVCSNLAITCLTPACTRYDEPWACRCSS